MKTNLIPAIRLTVVMLILTSVMYPLVVTGVAKFAPGGGKGVTVEVKGRVIGYALIGQKFTEDRYFNSRPSAVEYNAVGSGGSNKGPSNPDYLQSVQARIDTFLVRNPTVKKADIPVELVTASGSGLDPDLSPVAAKIQIARVAKVRNLSAERLSQLVDEHTNGPLLGLFGPSTVNVLKLNSVLDALK